MMSQPSQPRILGRDTGNLGFQGVVTTCATCATIPYGTLALSVSNYLFQSSIGIGCDGCDGCDKAVFSGAAMSQPRWSVTSSGRDTRRGTGRVLRRVVGAPPWLARVAVSWVVRGCASENALWGNVDDARGEERAVRASSPARNSAGWVEATGQRLHVCVASGGRESVTTPRARFAVRPAPPAEPAPSTAVLVLGGGGSRTSLVLATT